LPTNRPKKISQRLISPTPQILDGKLDINDLQEDEKWCINMKYRHKEQVSGLIKLDFFFRYD